MRTMIPATKRQCAKRECGTYLNSYNEGRYCSLHSFQLAARQPNHMARDPNERPATFAYRLASPAPRQPWQPVSRAA